MNSIDIANVLSKNQFTKNIFRGVYSSNNIATYTTYPNALVVNTDRMGERGTHWIAIYVIDDKHVEYFDSFGEEPNNDIAKFLQQFENINKNKLKIQSTFDISCGPHVIYYIVQRCRGKTLTSILKELNSPYSDSFVKIFVYNLLKL